MSETLAPTRPSWSLGIRPREYVITNVRAVLPDRITDSSAVAVRDGIITDVVPEAHGMQGDVDGSGMLLSPGFIDVHSDALEKEHEPRPSATLPWAFAVGSFESKLVGAGTTTIFHGAGFHRKASDGVARTPEKAMDMCRALDAHTRRRVDHRVLHRFDVMGAGAELIEQRMEENPASCPILLSHEDHTPGQGQYADVEKFVDTLVAGGEDRDAARARVQERMERAERNRATREANLAWAGEVAAAGRARLMGHDPDSAEAIDALVARGGTVAEFPTTLEAARRAKELGLLTVAGAPNVLRGGSHSGNVSALELIREGLVDALASDYLINGLLGAVTALVRAGEVAQHEAYRLITAGPAAVAGLADRGSIAPGLRADMVLIDDRGTWPHVVQTFSAEEVEPGL